MEKDTQPAKLKGLYIKTYGCQMNVYDSDRMADLLKIHGYHLTDQPDTADIAILNTCHIREKATEKVFSELGRLKNQQKTDQVLIVAGCVAQAEGQEIRRRAPYVDLVIGPQSYHLLPELIEKVRRKNTFLEKEDHISTQFPVESKFDFLPPPTASSFSTFLSIQEGCDKFCTFCVVPYTRGAEYSRPLADLIKDTKHLVANGVKEITLLGQNVNAYHGTTPAGTEIGLGELCLELAKIDGLERIRYTTSHPRDVDDALINAHGDCTKLMPFIHLPVQSGSNSMLKAMNRRHTVETYRKIIADFRNKNPELAFSSDFIVGFPGESDRDFQDTLDLVHDITFAQAFSFKYSPRPGTPASVLDPQVPEPKKNERLQILQKILFDQQLAFNTSFIGKKLDVLVERTASKQGHYLGKSPFMQSVVIQSESDIIGKIVNVFIQEAGFKVLNGKLIDEHGSRSK